MRRPFITAAALVLSVLVLFSCASPSGISAFAESAQNGIADGPSVFNDLYASCARRETLRPDRKVYPAFVPPSSKQAAPKDNPDLASCSRFETEGKQLDKMSDVLNAYFKSMEKLAGFNATDISGNFESIAENSATAAELSYTQIESAGKLASLVTQLTTQAYQTERLVKFIREADPAVTDLTTAFERVTTTYLDLLNQEQQTVGALYQTVGDQSAGSTLLLLNHAYEQDISKLQSRRSTATAYAGMLKDIREGHQKLATMGKTSSAKEVNATLAPYISKIKGALAAFQSEK